MMISTDPAAADAGDSRYGATLRVLYVEDDRLNAILFEEAVRLQPAIELQLAGDAHEAVLQAAQWRPDLLVLDAHLPDMNGHELLTALRRLAGLGNVPAIMCSADALAEDVQRARDAGFDGFWPKPIDVALILRELRERARSKAAREAAASTSFGGS